MKKTRLLFEASSRRSTTETLTRLGICSPPTTGSTSTETLRWIVRPESVSSSPSSPRSPTSVTRCRIDSLERDDGHSGDRERDSQQRDQHHPRWPGQDRRTLWV